MTELKRESSEAPEAIGEQTAARAYGNRDDTEGGSLAGAVADTYDALDYRLMGTFPASDAVAQY